MKTKNLLVLASFLIVLVIFPRELKAQSTEGFIYGKVFTVGGDVFEGQIRWGKEEAYWFDFFNATKEENSFLRYLDRDEIDDLEKRSDEWGERWTRNWLNFSRGDSEFNHTFVCQFGDIKSITVRSRNRVEMELKDGQTLHLDDGSNDVGARLRVMDAELGEVQIKWDRLDRVEFLDTPKNLTARFGDPIYGTVKTRRGEITGFIQWDHDERLGSDELDGETRDDDFSIPFRNIKSIEKGGRGVDLVTKSGREMYLIGSNDVNSENRGIIVNTPGEGRVDIPWREFESVEFLEVPKNRMPTYSDFEKPKSLSGTVTTVNGKSYSGKIIFDLDEELDIEIIQGESDNIEYLIPFRAVKRIHPKNYNYSAIELKNGEKLVIGDSQDVSEKNYGILVFQDEDNYKYIAWEDLEEIVFK